MTEPETIFLARAALLGHYYPAGATATDRTEFCTYFGNAWYGHRHQSWAAILLATEAIYQERRRLDARQKTKG